MLAQCNVILQNASISFRHIHFGDKIELILYPRVRNSITYLTIMYFTNKIVTRQALIKYYICAILIEFNAFFQVYFYRYFYGNYDSDIFIAKNHESDNQ